MNSSHRTGGFPKNLKDVVDLVSPAVKVGSKIVQAAAETDVEEVTDDLKDAVETLPDTVQNIDSPIEELGPGAAILGASYVANRVAHTSVLALSAKIARTCRCRCVDLRFGQIL